MWVFLDEANTCDHLGVVKELLCHQSLDGRPLDARLVIMAACNPYRLADTPRIQAGLDAKSQQVPTDSSPLSAH